MPRAITPELVCGLWDHLEDHYHSTRARKTATEMQLAASVLDAMGILDADAFLSRYTTTLGTTIYTPYEIGVGDERELAAQVRICVHEHQHVVQYREGGFAFAWEYITDSARRAYYEAAALTCNLELHRWMYGTMLDRTRLAGGLKHYGCTKADIAVCEKHLAMTARVVEQGAIVSDAGKVAFAWLSAHHE